ncbi:Ppx/GppA phosphatase family protein [Oxalobacter paraformigenes]|uniref:Exopolyphosphatase n=1 Tax=Oxalobacter paraformigenes TaxID=556268 RepID=C3X4T2_9BURK|nr:Ppx/GppA phosphatase family protein [Oxalobacter paraformigenes]EEO28218.1 exopolyphosphatase [Oxalobacter paraformigenes]
MFAAIDLGSNSFRLHIGEYVNGVICVVKSAREPNRLAAGLDKNNVLSEEAMARGLEALKKLRAILDAYPLSDVRAVATNTLRIASNAPVFLQNAEKVLGYPIEVISGEEEGRLIYLGVANVLARPEERRLVIDIGGGSTELICGKGQEIERVESFSVGTVRQSLAFFHDGIIDGASFEAAILSARSQFEDAVDYYRSCGWTEVYGSSGTIRAIAEILAVNRIGDGRFTLENLERLREKMIGAGHLNQLKLDGIKAERASSILGGLTILVVLLKDFGIGVLKPIEAGLRMGIMWDIYLMATEKDRREEAIREMLKRYQVDEQRAIRVANYALAIYKQMNPEADKFLKLLYWSALLHEIGIFISPTNYHKHGAYLIENADMAGFTAREQRQMSRFVLGQKGNLRKLNGIMTVPDAIKAVLALRLAVMFQHSKVNFKPEKIKVRVKNRIEMTMPKEWLNLYPTLLYWLERECDWWEEVGIALTVRTV